MNLRVLIVEDSPADLELSKEALRRTAGPALQIGSAPTVGAALKLLKETPYDVVLADLNLPDSEGLETVRALTLPDGPPVVAHTGTLDESAGLKAIVAGADDYVVKASVEGRRLRQILEFAAQRRRRAAGLPQSPNAKLEDVILERTHALAEANEQFRVATSSLSEVIFLAQIDPFRVLFINDAYRAMFERDPERLLEDPYDWLEAVHPEDRANVRAYLGADPSKTVPFLRYRTITPVQGIRWAQVRVAASKDAEGRPAYWAGSIQDVTAVVHAEQVERRAFEEKKKLEAVTEANRFKAEFLNMAAHEIANPLTPIRLQLYLVRGLVASINNEVLSHAVDVLDRNTTRLSGLVQDMLSVGRLQARTLNFTWTEVDLTRMCEEAITTMRPIAQVGKVEIRLEAPRGLRARADRTRLSEVILNLLSNAIKYTPGPGHATLRLRKEGSEAVFECQDTGRGIAPSDLPTLFSPFVRVGDTSKVQGTGLGLFICKGFVETHGGSIACTSEGLGKGTRVTVRIPLAGPRAPMPLRAEAVGSNGKREEVRVAPDVEQP